MVNCVPSHFRALCSIIFFMLFPVSAWVLSTSGAQSSSMCVHRVAAHTFSLTSALSDISFPAALRGWAVPWWFLEPGEVPPVLTEAARPHGCQNFDIYTSSRRKSLCVEWRQETKLGIYPILFVSEKRVWWKLAAELGAEVCLIYKFARGLALLITNGFFFSLGCQFAYSNFKKWGSF